MTRILTNPDLIDEAVENFAGYFGQILVNKEIDKAAAMTELFGKFRDYLKSAAADGAAYYDGDEDTDAGTRVTDAVPHFNDRNDVSVLPEKLEGMIAALIEASPSLTRQAAVHHLLHSQRGRLLASHISNNLMKGESMSRLEQLTDFAKQNGRMTAMAKHIIAKGGTAVTEHEYTATLMEYCKLHKRDGESDVTAFSRIFEAPESLDFRRAYAIIKGFPNMMDTTPVSTEVGSTETSDDSAAALRQLNELAEKQRALAPTLTIQQAFARVFENPDNRALAARAHRRPTASSTSGSELQQR